MSAKQKNKKGRVIAQTAMKKSKKQSANKTATHKTSLQKSTPHKTVSQKTASQNVVSQKPIIFKGNKVSNQTIIHKHHGFVCQKCGYPAYKLSKHTHCPLCIICAGCGFSIRNCKCIEGE